MPFDLLLLASGLATRLQDIVERGEKHLLPLSDGEPLVIRTIKVLSNEFDIHNVYIVVRKDVYKIYESILRKYMNNLNIKDILLIQNNKYFETNNSYTLYIGLKNIIDTKNINDIIIMNADIVILGRRCEALKEIHIKPTSSELLGLVSRRYRSPVYMKAYIDNNTGYIKYIGFDIPNHIDFVNFLGIFISKHNIKYFFNIFKEIGEKTDFICWYENILNMIITTQKFKIKAVPLFDMFYWDEVDNLEDIVRVQTRDAYLKNVSC